MHIIGIGEVLGGQIRLLVVVGGSRSGCRCFGAELKDRCMVECWGRLGIVAKRQGRQLGRLGTILSRAAAWTIGLGCSLSWRRVDLRSLSLSRWWLW